MLRCYRSVSVWQLLLELLNFLHMIENTHTHPHTLTLAQNTILRQKSSSLICPFFPCAPSFVWSSVSFSSLASSSAPSFVLVLRSCPRWLFSSSPFTLRRWLCSLSALLSPMSWKTHLSNTGSSSRRVSSSPVAKYEELWSKQVYSESPWGSQWSDLLLIFFFYWWWMQQLVSIGVLLTAS